MRLNLLIIGVFIVPCMSFAQDTAVIWINNIDSLNFKISYNRNGILKEFYKTIGVDSKSEITNPSDKWTPSCVARPHSRLNWIAQDKNRHWVISITYGGKGVVTNYYFFDKEKGKLNVNELTFGREQLSLAEAVQRIKSNSYEREDIDLPQ